MIFERCAFTSPRKSASGSATPIQSFRPPGSSCGRMPSCHGSPSPSKAHVVRTPAARTASQRSAKASKAGRPICRSVGILSPSDLTSACLEAASG